MYFVHAVRPVQDFAAVLCDNGSSGSCWRKTSSQFLLTELSDLGDGAPIVSVAIDSLQSCSVQFLDKAVLRDPSLCSISEDFVSSFSKEGLAWSLSKVQVFISKRGGNPQERSRTHENHSRCKS